MAYWHCHAAELGAAGQPYCGCDGCKSNNWCKNAANKAANTAKCNTEIELNLTFNKNRHYASARLQCHPTNNEADPPQNTNLSLTPIPCLSSMSYSYTPIDAARRAFRLITVLPPQKTLIGVTLRVKISECDLTAPAHYDALSYVWGQGRATRKIIVETDTGPRSLHITPALEQALSAIQGTAPLFVDQICINQGDDAEKAHQVQLMQHVYSSCRRTIVWLGPATRLSDSWFACVQDISEEGVLSWVMGPRVAHFMHVFDAVMDPAVDVDEQDRRDRDDILALLDRYGDEYDISGYMDVLDRPWFNRLWIIQEACLAPSVVFICGDKTLCFDCFRAGMLFYSIYNTHWVRQVTRPPTAAELRLRDAVFPKTVGFSRMFQERKAIHQTGKRRGFYDLVLKYNVDAEHDKIGAALAEDRIFGLLGLADAQDTMRKRVHVRYNKDQVAKVYTETAALLLEHDVDVILFSQFPKTTKGLPSWVPDWAMSLTYPVSYEDLNTPVFTAGGAKTDAKFSVDDGKLSIAGCIVDEISQIGERSYAPQVDPKIMQQVDYAATKLMFDEIASFVGDDARLRVCDSGLTYARKGDAGLPRLAKLYESLSQLGGRVIRAAETVDAYGLSRIYSTVGILPWYFTPPPEMDALQVLAVNPANACTTLVRALGDFVTDMSVMYVSSLRVKFASWRIWYRHRFGKVDFRMPDEALTNIGLDPDVVRGQDMADFTTNLLKNVRRRVYRTQNGRVGMCPSESCVGDKVVVLRGVSTPVVLRWEQGWKLVGEAYCDGVMDGAVTGDETFVIM